MNKDIKKPRILLLEDCPLTQRIHAQHLTDAGCIVDIAGNCKTAMQFYKPYLYDMALLDIELPDGRGSSICLYLRKQRDGQDMFVFTVSTNLANKKESVLAGADGFFLKPLAPNEVAKIIKRCFGKTRGERPNKYSAFCLA